MKTRKLLLILLVSIIMVILIAVIYHKRNKDFYNYKNKYDNIAIRDADIISTDVNNNVKRYTSDDKVNTVIEQVEQNYNYTFKGIEIEYYDNLTNIYVRCCLFIKADGTECTVFINTLSDETVIAQVE